MPVTMFKKARLNMDKDKAIEIALGLGVKEVPEIVTVQQEDVFFKTLNSNAKLKLRREIGHDLKEVNTLIASRYSSTQSEVRVKTQHVESTVENADLMEALLETSLGSLARIVKTRCLIGIQRFSLHCDIHLDSVEGLGEFIEFEIVENDIEGSDMAELLMKDVAKSFGIRNEDFIDVGIAYVDLVLSKQK